MDSSAIAEKRQSDPSYEASPIRRRSRRTEAELDAIPSHKLRDLVRDSITRHIDKEVYQRTLEAEEAERESLRMMMNGFENGGAAP